MFPYELKFEKRLETSRFTFLLVLVLSVALALIFGGVLLALAGANPFTAYRAMINGSFGSSYNLTETLVRATPLIFTGLSVAIAFRMRFWNIGAEGQLVMGGVAAVWTALFLTEHLSFLPDSGWLWIPIMMLTSVLAGAIWGLIPALLKAYLSVNEIITTLMFNYIAIFFYQYLYNSPWKDPAGFGFPGSAQIPDYTKLRRISSFVDLPLLTGRVHLGLIFGLISVVVVWVIMSRTSLGYEIRLAGENPNAARYAGVSLFRNILIVMLLSGGLAGLAGFSEIGGVSFRLQQGLDAGNGFTGIIVAWLARLNPFGVIAVSVLLSGLLVGSDALQFTSGIQLPAAVGPVLQGAILLCVLGADIFTRYRLRVIRRDEQTPASSRPSHPTETGD
jgi:simple sugar transport system permease protein